MINKKIKKISSCALFNLDIIGSNSLNYFFGKFQNMYTFLRHLVYILVSRNEINCRINYVMNIEKGSSWRFSTVSSALSISMEKYIRIFDLLLRHGLTLLLLPHLSAVVLFVHLQEFIDPNLNSKTRTQSVENY